MQGESQCWRHCVYCHCTTRVDIAWRDVILCAINPHGPAEGVARMAGQRGHQAGQRFIIVPSWADVRGTFARCTSSPSRQDGKPGVQLLFLTGHVLRSCDSAVQTDCRNQDSGRPCRAWDLGLWHAVHSVIFILLLFLIILLLVARLTLAKIKRRHTRTNLLVQGFKDCWMLW